MPEPPDALDGNNISGPGAAMAQRVERSNAGTHQRARFGGIQPVRDCREPFGGSEHVLLIAAIKVDPRNFLVVARNEIALATGRAGEVVTAVPADADSLPFFP